MTVEHKTYPMVLKAIAQSNGGMSSDFWRKRHREFHHQYLNRLYAELKTIRPGIRQIIKRKSATVP